MKSTSFAISVMEVTMVKMTDLFGEDADDS